MSDVLRQSGDESVLFLEPFYGGSHRQLIDLLHKSIPQSTLLTLPATKWHWRARTSALYFSCEIPRGHSFRVLFASSVLNLAELVSLRPDLAGIRKVLYFHENQLVYPVKKQQDRDFQYGYNQILSCLVADVIMFNSHYNQESFLNGIESFLKLMPDRPRNLAQRIRPKCQVLYFPIDFPTVLSSGNNVSCENTNAAGRASETDYAAGQRTQRHTPEQSAGFVENMWKELPSSNNHRNKDSICPTVSSNGSIDLLDADNTNNAGKTSETTIDHAADQRTQRHTPDQTAGFLDYMCTEQPSSDNHRSKDSICPTVSSNGSNDLLEADNSNTAGMASGRDRKKFEGNEGFDAQQRYASTEGQGDAPFSTEESILSQDFKQLKSSNEYPADIRDCQSVHIKSGQKDKYVTEAVDRPLHILWPHRWEHDKNPEEFFSALLQLSEEGCSFHLSVLGENYLQIPAIFKEAEVRLKEHIVNFGFLPSKELYYQVLSEADVVVSTAKHEFFGVAMLEATHFNCYPLCPNRLVYPEIYPAEYLYRTPTQLLKRLRRLCKHPKAIRGHVNKLDLLKYSWKALEADYLTVLFGT